MWLMKCRSPNQSIMFSTVRHNLVYSSLSVSQPLETIALFDELVRRMTLIGMAKPCRMSRLGFCSFSRVSHCYPFKIESTVDPPNAFLEFDFVRFVQLCCSWWNAFSWGSWNCGNCCSNDIQRRFVPLLNEADNRTFLNKIARLKEVQGTTAVHQIGAL